MKISKSFNCFYFFTALSFLIVPQFPVHAQSYFSTSESGKAYWQVHTDNNSKTTTVRFFDANHQLVYLESLPDKYIRLSRHNIRRFDELLDKLVSKNLLTSVIRSHDLVADVSADFREMNRYKVADNSNAAGPLLNNVYVSEKGRLRVVLTNPGQQPVMISIKDATTMIPIYREPTNLAAYNRWFDISQLEEGTYRVQIDSPNQTLKYKLVVDAKSTIQPYCHLERLK